MRRLLLLPLLFMLAVSLLPLMSANVIFGQTNTLYNLGDTLQISAVVKPSDAVNGFLELNLNCGDSSINFYRTYISLNANEEKQVSSEVPLSRFFVSQAGVCRIAASMGEEKSYSQDITISDKINVILNSLSGEIMPGSEILVEGTAVKENSQNVEGFVNVYINSEINMTVTVSQGKFSTKLSIPKNMGAGSHAVNAYVYEKIDSDDGTSNSGSGNFFVIVKSVPTEIEIALDSGNVNPGATLSYKPMLYDQAHELIADREVTIKISDSNNKLLAEKAAVSGKQEELKLDQTASAGKWTISASSLEVSGTKEFNVNELQQASLKIDNNTLVVVNTGNVPYQKTIEVTIGDTTKMLDVDVPVSESKKFKLYAPEGSYIVKASDGAEEVEVSGVALTGRAIDIVDASQGIEFKRYILAWIFLFAVVGWFVYSKYSNFIPWTKKYNVPETIPEQKTHHPIMVDVPAKKMSEVVLPDKAIPSQAEHTIALNGQKQESSLLVLNIKNSDKMAGFKDTINEIVQDIVANKGSIYQSNNFLFGIFPPVSTKTYRNEVPVIKLAKQVEGKLNAHNAKFKEKIDYGLVVHSGQLVVEKTKDRLKFAGLGNTIGMAKKLAEISHNEFLISEDAFKNAASDIKAFRQTKDNLSMYKLQKIVDREDSDKFIRNFLDKNYK